MQSLHPCAYQRVKSTRMNEDNLEQEVLEGKVTEALEAKKAMVIFQDTDGNYRGAAYKADKLIQARAGDPNTVVTLLITHP